MPDNKDFTFAVARVRSAEARLMTDNDIESLVEAKSGAAVKAALEKRGCSTEGFRLSGEFADELAKRERASLWEFAAELCGGETLALAPLCVRGDFHNLKAAVKSHALGYEEEGVYMRSGISVSPELTLKCVKDGDFSPLPEYMRDCAEQTQKLMLGTHDAQLCDMSADRGALEALNLLSRKSGLKAYELYARNLTAFADINLAVRMSRLNKPAEMIRLGVAALDGLDTERLIKAASRSPGDVYAFLDTTEYSGAAAALREKGAAAFEKWFGDRLVDALRPQKYNPFSLNPVVAYLIARENEIKNIRLILILKSAGISAGRIRERCVKSYV